MEHLLVFPLFSLKTARQPTPILGRDKTLGLAPQSALTLFEREIEPACSILVEPASVFGRFKRLIAKYSVTGKQVHDARLVAMMLAWQIENVLTLNDRGFRRYEPEGIQVVTPESLAASGAEASH
jgi:hypothetical protein